MTFPNSDRLSTTGRAAFIGFCAIAAVFLIYEHTMHVLGALPYLLLLACPLMHMFMHHGHHQSGGPRDGADSGSAGRGAPSHVHGLLPGDDRDSTEADHA